MSLHNSGKSSTGRLIVDAPASGAWNMAVDETLVQSAAEQGICTLRFYEWSEPTLSLGYFQRYDERRQHAGSRDCQAVRRSSGGGAIVHDRELTYCLAAPEGHPLAMDAQRLYTLVHEALIGALANWRISARRFGASASADAAVGSVSNEPFLCFARRAAEDVVLDRTSNSMIAERDIRESNANKQRSTGDSGPSTSSTAKVCGSAQRRRRGAIVQHGSLLLAASSAAVELPGIVELTGVSLSIAEMIKNWSKQLENTLPIAFSAASLSAAEVATARDLAIGKYSLESWNRRR